MSSPFAVPTTEEQAATYRGIRDRVRAVVDAAGPNALEAQCALTPAWRARDVVAHLVGVPSDVLAGRMHGVATDAWTQAQVDGRRSMSVAEMLDEWDAALPQIEAIMGAFPPAALGQMIFDATTHEHDVRHALGACGARDSDAVRSSFAWAVGVAAQGRAEPIALRTDLGEFAVGEGSPVATIAVSSFDYVRATAGRRSAAQVAAFDWHGAPPRPELLLAAPLFRFAVADVVEAPV